MSWAEFANQWAKILRRHHLAKNRWHTTDYTPCLRTALMYAIGRIAVEEFNGNTMHGNTSRSLPARAPSPDAPLTPAATATPTPARPRATHGCPNRASLTALGLAPLLVALFGFNTFSLARHPPPLVHAP